MMATHVIYDNEVYTIPAGATAEYSTSGALTGYFTTSQANGGIAEYNTMNGVSTLSGYHVPLALMQGSQYEGTPSTTTTGTMGGYVSAPVNYGGFNMGSSTVSSSSGSRPSNSVSTCNPVAPVPHAMP